MTSTEDRQRGRGQVNRLKPLKRNRYGRAKFDLLRKHVLGMSVTG